MRLPPQHPQNQQMLGDCSADGMPYAQPAGQPPHGQGYYGAPTQMMSYPLEQLASLSPYQIMSNIAADLPVLQQSHVNDAQGLRAYPPNATLQYYSNSEATVEEKSTDPRNQVEDMETCPVSLTYP